MRIVIDMNLSPDWVQVLAGAGHDAVHWSTIGPPAAADREVLSWAQQNQRTVFTHDLDFGTILAATDANAPSVIQLRTQDTLPDAVGPLVLAALAQFESQLAQGALIIVDVHRSRARVLPIRRSG